MIITIKGANFSLANIGTLSTYIISKSIGNGATFDIPNFVDKNSSVNWTITLDEGYTFGTYSVTMGGVEVTPTVVDNVMTISITEVTGNVRIVVATVNENTGEEDDPTIPDEPTIYTLTISPNPSDATVKLTASGYTQIGNSITVQSGTSVSYTVNKTGYVGKSANVVVNSNQTITVTLEVANIENQIDLGTINDRQWIKFETGADQTLNNWKSTDYITIPDGVTSIHSDDITAFRQGGNNTTPYAFYDVDKNYISGVDMETIPVNTTGVMGSTPGAWRNSLTYDVPENAAYVRICWTVEKYKHMTTGVSTAITSPIVQWVY
jgi:hypothetical protein